MRKAIGIAYLCFILAMTVSVASTVFGYRYSEMYTQMIPSLMAVVSLLAIMQVAYSRKIFDQIRNEIEEVKKEIRELHSLARSEAEKSEPLTDDM